MVVMATGQAFLASLAAFDGSTPPKPAPVSNVRWVSSDPAKLVVSPLADDPMLAHVAAALNSGGATYTITVTADANLDPAVTRDIVTALDVQVGYPNLAQSLVITPGAVYGEPQA